MWTWQATLWESTLVRLERWSWSLHALHAGGLQPPTAAAASATWLWQRSSHGCYLAPPRASLFLVCPFCSGMWEDLDEAFPELTAKLEAFGAGTDRALFITGHSLGAALSGLSAARLTAEGYNVSGEGPVGAYERWWQDHAFRAGTRCRCTQCAST